jgi:hypothetical protein
MKTLVSDFLSIYRIYLPGNFLLGLLGWRERTQIRGSPVPVPRNDKGRELAWDSKLFLTDNPVIPSFQRK